MGHRRFEAYGADTPLQVDFRVVRDRVTEVTLESAELEQIIAADKRVLSEPAPVIVVGELADSSVNFLVRPWVNKEHYWPLLWDTTETVKLKFDEAGLSIPFPQMDVHFEKKETVSE